MHRPVVKTTCRTCDAELVALEDDQEPMCETCLGARDGLEVAKAVMRGELDHLVPGLGVPYPGEEDD